MRASFVGCCRARRERPRRRAAEQRDEVAPLHGPVSPVPTSERIAHLGPAAGAALRDFDPAYVSSGSSATERVEAAPRRMSASPRKLTQQTTVELQCFIG
jgi:hypothetical protein